MSCGYREISDYIDDLPMKISSGYMPRHFLIEIPEVTSIKLDEFEYEFKNEKDAISMAEAMEEEKRKEKERLLLLRSSHSLNNLHNPENRPETNFSPILPGSPCLPILPSVPVQEETINCTNTATTISASPSLRCSSEEVDPKMRCNDVNSLIARRNSVPNNLSTCQDNFGILRPIPSQFNSDTSKNHNNNNRQEFIPMNKIDPADFESSSSSPFDDALLKAIDDKQELNRVFQHL